MPSGAVTVGSLVINMSANTGQLKSDLGEVTAATKATSAAMASAWAGVAAESQNATYAGERMVAQLRNQIATFGMSSDELLQHKANLNGVGAEVQALMGRLDAMKSAQAAMTAETNAMAAAEANATSRIREMVAASLAEAAAVSSATQAIDSAAGAQARVGASAQQAAASSRAWQQNMAGVTASMQAASEQSVALSANTQRILDKYDPLGTKLRSLQADMAVLRKEMGASLDPAAMKAFQGLEDEIVKTKTLMAKAGVEGFGAMEEGAKKSAFATVGAKRELIVLGHEAMTGNFSRMPGSFLVLAERMSFTASLFSPMTLGMIGLAGAAIGVSVALAAGHAQMVAMNNALAVTSNYAGMSRLSMEQLAESMTQTHEVTIGAANAVVLALVSSGRIGGDAIAQIGHFISDFAKSTGKSVDEIAPKMISLFEDPIRGAQELNSSMHFLTTTQIEHIAALERTGQVQAAQQELAKAASDHMPKQAQSIGVVTAAVLEQRDAWTKLGQAIMNAGATRDQPDQRAQALRDQISEYLAKGLTRKDPAVRQVQAALDALDPLIAKQKEVTKAEKEAAAANELQAKSWDAVKSSSTAYHVQELRDKLTLINAHVSEAGPGFDAQETAKRDAIRKTNEEIASAYRSMGAEGRQLAQQQITGEEQLAEVRLKNAADAIDAKFKLGELTKEQFDMQMTNNALDVNSEKQLFERRMANVAGLTAAERGAHQQKLAQLQVEREGIEQKGANSVAVDSKKEYDDLMKAINASGDAELKSLDASIAKQREHNAEIGKSKEQIEAARQARVNADTEEMKREDDAIRAIMNRGDVDTVLPGKMKEVYAARLAYLDEEISRRRTLAGLLAQGADLEAGAKAAQELDKFLDPTKAHAFADTLTNAFGACGDSIVKMTNVLETFGAKQAQVDKQRNNAALAYMTGQKTEAQYLAAISDLNRQGAKNQVAGYAQMADAAQGFFKEGSKGYQAMHAASMVLHGAEVALSLVKGVNAVLTQGEGGDPYSAFARMAAMAAVVAGLGVALGGGGGGGGISAADRQKAQGTGSVLGDSSAKSDSIARSVALAADNSSTQINYLAGMLDALHNIETGIGSFAAQIVRTTGITGATAADSKSFSGKGVALAGAVDWGVGGAMLGSILGPIGAVLGGIIGAALGHTFVGKALSAVFGESQSVTHSGFTMGKSSLGSVLANGASASQYTDVTTAGGWFRSDKHNTNLASLGSDANAQFTTVLKSLALGITEAGKLLGVSGDQFDQHLQAFVVDIGKVSLKGLTGDEIQKQLEAVFSKLGDDMAQFAIGGLNQFQKVGEGYLETLTRVATDYAKLDASLASIGMTFGATGTASIAARENLVDLAGGIDKLQSQAASFAQNFLSKAEQIAPVAKYVSDQMAALGLSGIKTRDAFKQVVLGLDLSTSSGQKEYTALMALQDAFAATHAATVDLSKSEQEVADERKGLQDQLDQLTMTQTQLIDKQRNALAAANRPLFDLVQAAQKLSTMSGDLTKFRDSAIALRNGLATGSLSTLSPEQQYAELRRQYQSTLAAAMKGDTTAQGNFSAIANSFLTASQKLNGGDDQYSADFGEVLQASNNAAAWAASQVDSAQAQLSAMNQQVEGINTLNTTLSTLSDYIQGAGGSSTPIDPANYGSADSAAVLVAAVKSLQASNDDLKAEIAGLRADQQKQTGDTIASNDQSQQTTAQAIVGGLGGAISRAVAGVQKLALE